MFQELIKNLDINPTIITKLNDLSIDLKNCSNSLKEINHNFKDWVTFPTIKPSPEFQKSDLTQYIQAFDNLSLIFPLDDFKYNQIIKLRKEVNETRKSLNNLLKNKNEHPKEIILFEAKKLQNLLQQLRISENIFFEFCLHHWKTLLTSFQNDIKKN